MEKHIELFYVGQQFALSLSNEQLSEANIRDHMALKNGCYRQSSHTLRSPPKVKGRSTVLSLILTFIVRWMAIHISYILQIVRGRRSCSILFI